MEKYAGQYWSALSREVAAFVETKNLVEKKSAMATVRRNGAARPKIWIDMDNTPHVPFFEPIMRGTEGAWVLAVGDGAGRLPTV